MTTARFYTTGIGLFFAFVILSGGGWLGPSYRLLCVSVLSIILLFVAFWRLRNGLPNKTIYFAFVILFLAIALMLLQLVPLSPDVWSGLAGRGFIVKDFSVLGLNDQWLPLSLSPATTKQDIIALLPALAAFFAVLSLAQQNWRPLIWFIVALCALSALVGLAQRFQGMNGVFNFYNYSDPVFASGFFANRNHLAALLYSVLPFLTVIGIASQSRSDMSNRVTILLSVMLGAMMIAALGATASRMGAILLVVAILLIVCLMMSRQRSVSHARKRISVLGIIAVLIGGVVVAQLLLAALLRFAETDIASDYRGTIFETSVSALKAFFPVGSGFGTFVPAYQLFEQPNIMIEAYVNHAHNDWLELLIEGGLPMAIILASFLVWYLWVSFSTWYNPTSSLFAKAASISICLLLIHSLVDYPLRTPALMALFGLFCGILTLNSSDTSPRRPNKLRKRHAPTPTDTEPVGFRPSTRGFQNRGQP